MFSWAIFPMKETTSYCASFFPKMPLIFGNGKEKGEKFR
jgi:hypothetical protein